MLSQIHIENVNSKVWRERWLYISDPGKIDSYSSWCTLLLASWIWKAEYTFYCGMGRTRFNCGRLWIFGEIKEDLMKELKETRLEGKIGNAEKAWCQGVTTRDIRCTKGLDIRLISLISSCWIRLKHGCFQPFFKYFTLWPLSTDIGLIFRYIHLIFFDILPKSVRYLTELWSQFSLDIRLLYLWYPADILISGVQISSKMLPLA